MPTLSMNEAAFYASVFAVTNMGQPTPTNDTLIELRKDADRDRLTLTSAVYCTAQRYMENEEHEKLFLEEAKSWYDRFLVMERDEFFNTWPHDALLYEYPDAPLVGTEGLYTSHSPGATPKRFVVTGFMKTQPTICTCRYEGIGESFFIWTFNNRGGLKPITYGKPIEYNIMHAWEGKQ